MKKKFRFYVKDEKGSLRLCELSFDVRTVQKVIRDMNLSKLRGSLLFNKPSDKKISDQFLMLTF
jgi:hypothetical protein